MSTNVNSLMKKTKAQLIDIVKANDVIISEKDEMINKLNQSLSTSNEAVKKLTKEVASQRTGMDEYASENAKLREDSMKDAKLIKCLIATSVILAIAFVILAIAFVIALF